MTAHAVGHQKDVAVLPPLLQIGGQQHGRRILIMAAANPHVGQPGVFNLIVADHQGRLSILGTLVCYTSEWDLQRSPAAASRRSPERE